MQHPDYGYPIDFRRRAIAVAEVQGPRIAARLFNISERSVSRWLAAWRANQETR